MSQTHCPRCHEPIRLPEPLPASDASGQCPWCQETFTLHELLDQLPPMLQIIDAGSAMDAGPVTVETDEEDDSSFMLRDEEPAPPAPRPAPALHAPARRQKKSSPVKTILQIVGGGLVSIPLAFAILLLLKYFGVANPNVGFWPLDGTSFDRPVTATQPRAINEDNRSPEPEQGGRLLGDDMPDFGELDTDAEFDPMPNDLDEEADDDPFPTFDPSEPDESDQGDATDTEPEQPAQMTDPPDAGFSELTDDAAIEEPEDMLSISPTEIASPLSDSNSEVATASSEPLATDVEAVVNAAKQASTALADHSDPATRSDALKDLYLELAKLGELASPDQQSLFVDLFAQLRQENQLETMGRFGQPWFSASSRLYEGIFVTGTLEQQDDGYELHWEEGESVPVSGWDSYPDDPSVFVGKKVALLAKIDTAAESRSLLIGYLERLDRDSENAEQP